MIIDNREAQVMRHIENASSDGFVTGRLGGPCIVPYRYAKYGALSEAWVRGYKEGVAASKSKEKK